MKIGVLSDTHLPSVATKLPPAVFRIFRDADLILHAGDIVELSFLEELKSIAPVEAVAGNMDAPEVLARLPHKKVIAAGRFKIGLIHGKYRIDVQREMIRKEFDNVDCIVYGHSHTPFWGVENGTHYLNPGSPTDKLHAPFNSVAVLLVENDLHAEIVRI